MAPAQGPREAGWWVGCPLPAHACPLSPGSRWPRGWGPRTAHRSARQAGVHRPGLDGLVVPRATRMALPEPWPGAVQGEGSPHATSQACGNPAPYLRLGQQPPRGVRSRCGPLCKPAAAGSPATLHHCHPTGTHWEGLLTASPRAGGTYRSFHGTLREKGVEPPQGPGHTDTLGRPLTPGSAPPRALSGRGWLDGDHGVPRVLSESGPGLKYWTAARVTFRQAASCVPSAVCPAMHGDILTPAACGSWLTRNASVPGHPPPRVAASGLPGPETAHRGGHLLFPLQRITHLGSPSQTVSRGTPGVPWAGHTAPPSSPLRVRAGPRLDVDPPVFSHSSVKDAAAELGARGLREAEQLSRSHTAGAPTGS